MLKKTGHKILVLLLFVLVIQLIMFFLSLSKLNGQKSTGLVINLAGRQRMLSQKMTKELLDYLRSNSRAELDQLNKSIKVFDKTLTSLISGGDAPVDLNMNVFKSIPASQNEDIKKELEKIKSLWTQFKQKLEVVISSGPDAESLAYIRDTNIKLLAEMNKAVVLMQKDSEKSLQGIIYWQITGLIILILIVVSATIFFDRTVGQRLNNMVLFNEKLADGDLTQRVSVNGNDDIAVLEKSFNSLAGRFNEIIKTIHNMSSNLTNSAGDLSSTSDVMSSTAEGVRSQADLVEKSAEHITSSVDTVASAAEESSSSVSNISTMTEEMSSTFSNVAQTAQKTADNVKNMAHSSEDLSSGISSVAAAVEQMTASLGEVSKSTAQANHISQKANQRSNEINSGMQALVEASKQIDKVIEVIKDIADQTNMLALNATIEAAGAGEAGKGFAVVAGEVKELAKQSSDATDEIAGQIDQIQRSTDEAVKGIGEISTVISEIAEINETIASAVGEQSATAGEISRTITTSARTVKDVAANASESSNLVDEIARATEETSKTAGEVARHVDELSIGIKEVARSGADSARSVQEISNSIHGVNDASKETAAGAVQTSQLSNELSRMAGELSEIVSRFKI